MTSCYQILPNLPAENVLQCLPRVQGSAKSMTPSKEMNDHTMILNKESRLSLTFKFDIQLMQVFLIVVAVVASVLFLLVDLYLMAFYAHKQQSNLSVVNLLCKFLIVFTLLQCQFQPFFLILDVANSRTSSNDFTIIWLILYCSLIVNLAVLKPIATSLYERDHDDPCWKTALWTIIQIVISGAVFGSFLGIGWTFWSTVTIPVDLITVDAADSTIALSQLNQTTTQAHFQFSSSIICFVVAFFCIIGYPILACCGACGLTVLPLSLILDFVNRPKFRRTADAKKVSQFLKVQTIRLLRQNQRLQRQSALMQNEDGFFKRREVKNKFNQKLKAIEEQLEQQRDYYELFKMELEMVNVNPLWYWAKLILGVFAVLVSAMFWLQILLADLVFPQTKGYQSIFLDRMLNFMEAQNANFVSIFLLMLMVLFISCSIIKGSVFFSNSIPCLTIYPMVQGKTWLNSFLFHLSLCSLSSASLIHLLAQAFPYYLRGGSIVIMLNDILNNIKVVGFLLDKKVFTYWFLIVVGLGIPFVIYKMICASQNKGELLKRIEAKRIKLFGKQNQNQSIKFIEMTEMKGSSTSIKVQQQHKADSARIILR